MKADSFGATVECRQLSIIRSFYRGPWLSSIYTPPVTAQFLKDVSLQVGHGEIHGVMGAAGSRFTNLCEFVDFEVDLLTPVTVEQLLKYHACLSLNCNGDAVTHRQAYSNAPHFQVLLLMQQFDLAHVSAHKIGSLSESARRRVILVLHLIKDPSILY
ncbi:CBN-ABCH-1 protein [Aphelenchoides avenae]|nr:CBN-ABCH-1 protein [Aphelenchus avenae]